MQWINIHTHTEVMADNVITVVNQFPDKVTANGYFSVGLHPWYIKKETWQQQLQLLQNIVQHPNCIAIGEAGLDKVTTTNYSLQEEVFKAQVAISEKAQKPLIIHCVKSYQEIYKLKEQLQPLQTWVLHGFVKNEQVAAQMLSVGIKLSFGTALFKNSKVQRTFAGLSDNSFFLETDDSNTGIIEVYKKAAEVRQIALDVIKTQVAHNFKEVFKK